MYVVLQNRDQLKRKHLPWLDVCDLFGEIKLENVKELVWWHNQNWNLFCPAFHLWGAGICSWDYVLRCLDDCLLKKENILWTSEFSRELLFEGESWEELRVVLFCFVLAYLVNITRACSNDRCFLSLLVLFHSFKFFLTYLFSYLKCAAC